MYFEHEYLAYHKTCKHALKLLNVFLRPIWREGCLNILILCFSFNLIAFRRGDFKKNTIKSQKLPVFC